MPDRYDKLRATLDELDAQLAQLDSLDESTRAALLDAHAEITATLERGKRSSATKRAESSLQERLVEFEAANPQLAGVVSRLLDGLAQLGI
jgi:hypothetical protein